jgi:hypothetical protein
MHRSPIIDDDKIARQKPNVIFACIGSSSHLDKRI